MNSDILKKYGVRSRLGDYVLVSRIDKQAHECIVFHDLCCQFIVSRSYIIDTDDKINQSIDAVCAHTKHEIAILLIARSKVLAAAVTNEVIVRG